MPDVDFSSPNHRLDNLSNLRFVRAYARVRHHVYNDGNADLTEAFLKGYMSSLEANLATDLGLSLTTLVGRLVDLGAELCNDKDAKDEAESSPA